MRRQCAGVLFFLEETLEIVALANEAHHLLADSRRSHAKRLIGLAHGINMDGEDQANNAGTRADETRNREELAVGLQWICRQV